ncbi:hypothetical protein [Variovorax sp.]|uniref:hypothetical protein n=1 Tax=Variovorax sp. TaxID=1871043 RepID=UPI0012198E89|nr:hypothetical protein [Variovorax sp.]TAJ61156.1 MAG: hypothetical protein EPO53_24490 [Variovorax sp.]
MDAVDTVVRLALRGGRSEEAAVAADEAPPRGREGGAAGTEQAQGGAGCARVDQQLQNHDTDSHAPIPVMLR